MAHRTSLLHRLLQNSSTIRITAKNEGQSRRIGDPFYTFTTDIPSTSWRHQTAIAEHEREQLELDSDALRSSLALRPEELRQEPQKKENRRALNALGYEGITLAQRRTSRLSRASSKASSRNSSKARQEDASRKEQCEHSKSGSSSDSNDEDVDAAAGARQAAPALVRTRSLPCSVHSGSPSKNSVGGDHKQLGSTDHPFQVVVCHDDAVKGEKQPRALSSRSSQQTPFSPAARPASLTMHGVLNRISRRFSSAELGQHALGALSKAESGSSGNPDSIRRTRSLPGIRQTSLDDPAQPGSPPLSSCLSSAGMHALKLGARRASLPYQSDGAVGSPLDVFSSPLPASLAPRSLPHTGGARRSTGGTGLSGSREPPDPLASMFHSSRLKRAVSFKEGITQTGAAAGSKAVESQSAAVAAIEARRAASPGQRHLPQRTQSTSKLSHMSGSADALRELLGP